MSVNSSISLSHKNVRELFYIPVPQECPWTLLYPCPTRMSMNSSTSCPTRMSVNSSISLSHKNGPWTKLLTTVLPRFGYKKFIFLSRILAAASCLSTHLAPKCFPLLSKSLCHLFHVTRGFSRRGSAKWLCRVFLMSLHLTHLPSTQST